MHFYDYYQPSDVIDNPSLLAAQSLIENGIEVVPLQKGLKEPTKEIKSLAELRQHPLNTHNVKYYFDRTDDVDIAIMLRRNMEVIDVDAKNKEGLSDKFLNSLKHGWPELYDKLVISKTPNKGLHILYYSDKVGGDGVLAYVPNPKGSGIAIVERLNESNKSYIKCAPSTGYEFIKGNPMDMPRLTIEERDWLSALGASFNELFIPEVKRKEAEREDSPWTVFNKDKNWEYIWDELKQRNWECLKDLTDKIIVRMPNGQQHSGVIWKDTNLLHLYTTNSEFEGGKSYSPFGVYCFYYHDGNIALASKKLAADGIGVNKFEEGQFWKKQGKKIVVKYTELVQWLSHIGFRIYQNEIVKITNNIVSVIEERELKSMFLREIEPEAVDYFYEKVSVIFSENGGLMAMLDKLEDNFIKDTTEQTWLFFKNYAVRITETDILPLQYKEVAGYIWSDSIIDRNFYNEDFNNCDAERFVSILGGIKKDSLCKLIGYAISRFKDPINPKAIILIEDIDSDEEGESQGGSGKGLLFNFIRQFRKVCDFDGKNFKISDNFLYQNIEPDTNIIFIDDVEKHFKFSALFSILTGALIVNKKNKPQIIIPYDSSPKIFITSNFSVGAMDISSRRRKYEFAIVKHFGIDREPIDEFGRQFFAEWDKKEWLKFDNFIAHCCQLYIKDTDKKHIGNMTEHSIERSLISNTNKDFLDYMDGQLLCHFYDFAPHELKTYSGLVNGVTVENGVNYKAWSDNMKLENPDTRYYLAISKEEFLTKITQLLKVKNLSTTKITQWLNKWAHSRNVEIDTKFRRGANNEMCYRVMKFKSVQADLKVLNEQNESVQSTQSEPEIPF